MKLTIVCYSDDEFAAFEAELEEAKVIYPAVTAYNDINVIKGDIRERILSGNYDAVLSPGNSFGMLTGGVDLVMLQTFGLQLEVRLVDAIANSFSGELPVGSAAMLRTVNPACPWFVSAPTMRLPAVITEANVIYKAVYAARDVLEDLYSEMQEEASYNDFVEDKTTFVPPLKVVTPCFGTGTGKVPPAEAAKLMMRAWIDHDPISD